VRIISGQWRSRPLAAPEGDATRPTADRVRETLFSMLVSRIGSFEGLLVLDLFAGSGALGLEALSRGAARAVMVEQAPAARDAIQRNIRALGANAQLLGMDALNLPNAVLVADIVFLDPPYGEGLAPRALASALSGGWISPAAFVSVETGRDEVLDVPGFALDTRRTVAKAALHILRPALQG